MQLCLIMPILQRSRMLPACRPAYGRFSFPKPLKIRYSGDCRPSDELIQVGQNATFLIHEATLENDMYQDAVDKKHCTTGEALEVAKK